MADIPQPFATHLEEIAIEIRTRPTRKQLHEAGLAEDELLLGLYLGHPMTERSVTQGARLPDMILIFQEDIELVSDTEQDLVREIRTTVLHEIGHHFGMDEDDLNELGYS